MNTPSSPYISLTSGDSFADLERAKDELLALYSGLAELAEYPRIRTKPFVLFKGVPSNHLKGRGFEAGEDPVNLCYFNPLCSYGNRRDGSYCGFNWAITSNGTPLVFEGSLGFVGDDNSEWSDLSPGMQKSIQLALQFARVPEAGWPGEGALNQTLQEAINRLTPPSVPRVRVPTIS